jgi:hypothetical protein
MHNHDDMQITVYEYRPEREREAYALWSGSANGNMTEVARQTEIPIRTLFSWRSRYHWKAEKSSNVRHLTEDAIEAGKLQFSQAYGAAAKRLVTMLRDDKATHAEQRENIRLLVELTNDPEAEAAQTLVDARSIHIQASELDDPLRAASAALAANVGQASLDSRKGKRRGHI